MPIKVSCACGKKLSVKDELAGRTLKCPACQKPLRVPKPKVEEEPAEEDFDDEPSDAPAKSRGGKSSPSRGAVSRKSSVKSKGKKSKSSNRGLLIGLSAGGGVLVVALLAWMLWPAAPAANVAGNPPANQEQTAAPASGDAAKPIPSAETAAANSPTNVGGDDLKALQGDWHFVDMQTDPPAPPAALAAIKLTAVTFVGDSMTMESPSPTAPKTTFSIKLDSSQNPKAIDLTAIDGPRKDKTGLGIFSLEGQVLKLCIHDSNRPTSWTPTAGAREGIMVLSRGRPAGLANAPIPEDKFDHKAWERVKPTLAQLGIQGQLLTRREAPESIPDGLQTVAVLLLPKLPASDIYPENILSTIKSLSHVVLKTLEMSDAKLQQLSEHPGLIGLNLSGQSVITANGLAHLKRCPLLRHLYLEQVSVTPDLMKVIGEFSNLGSLSLNDMPVTDEFLSNVLPLKGLETLSLQNTAVTDAGAAQLVKLSSLKALLLDGSKVTDQGLPSLKSLNKLTLLSVRRLNVSPQAVDELQKELPGCKILK